uniref:EGF-like domain-containing protein n=1 Tax=Eptatretus burgeri TaxID=7764 RepID=A0A8C4N144_EPTBU
CHQCQPGWEGEFCDRCTSYPGCVHGSCQQPWQCNCEPGWTGHLNHCANAQPCNNNGSCMDNGAGSFTCLCPPGFTGKLTAQSDACSGLCANGARCRVLPGRVPRCECAPGFVGRLCIKHLPCSRLPADAPCVNGGKCGASMDGTFHCICPWGFFGKRCEQRTNTRSPAEDKQRLLHITLMQTQAGNWDAYSKTWWLVLGLLATFVMLVLGSIAGILCNAPCEAWATRVLHLSRLPPLEGQHDELLRDNLVSPARLKLTNQQRASQTRATSPSKELA